MARLSSPEKSLSRLTAKRAPSLPPAPPPAAKKSAPPRFTTNNNPQHIPTADGPRFPRPIFFPRACHWQEHKESFPPPARLTHPGKNALRASVRNKGVEN